MINKDQYAQILDIKSPRRASNVELTLYVGEVTVHVEQEEGCYAVLSDLRPGVTGL